jgi:hypothetical protein
VDKSILEVTALESFRKWLEGAKLNYPALAQVPEYLLLSCFYAGAAFGSDQSGKIWKGLIIK